MQAIGTLYSLFGLVIGLGIAGILSGFARAWRITVGVGAVKGDIRIGWLVPLLASLVIMDQTHFYLTAYVMRDAIPFTYFSLLSVLAVVGTYFVCSTFVFPEDPADWPDFDAYYLQVRRIVAGGMLAVKVALVGFVAVLAATGHRFDTPGQATLLQTAMGLLFLPLVTALIFVRGRRIHLVLLILLNLSVLLQAIAPILDDAI